MPDPTIGTLPLDQLEISTANVRSTPAGKSAFDELKASIAAHGLLENLVARPLGADTQGKPRYAVIAGGRRLAALNELAADGVLAQDHPVPCRVVRNGAADSEISLAENVVRVAMHPADQVEAFGALALAGATAADIAARFGVSERTVEQRLRLGHAAPELLDAYRTDQIDLATLKAFAVTTDTARQLAVWEQVKDQGYAAALAWAPPGFNVFDSGHVDDEDDGHDAAASAKDTPVTTAPAPDEPSAGDVRSGDQPDPAAAEPDAPANGDASPPATADTEAHASLPADPAAPAPAESPENAEPDVRTPGVQDAIDAMNRVPTADGAPRVIISTVGFESEPPTQAGAESDAPPPPPVNGAATAATAEALDVPAFLRRS